MGTKQVASLWNASVFSGKLQGPLVMLAASIGVAAAQAADWSVSAGIDYSRGKYGGSEATEIWYVPLSLKRESGQSTLKLTLPWVCMSSPSGGNIIDVDTNGQPIYDGTGPRVSEQGPGDVVVAYTWNAWPAPVHGFLLDLGAKLKLATADENKGLGSGKHDISLQTDLYYLAGKTTPFLTLGHRRPGDPSGLSLRNQWYGTLGLAYKQSAANNFGVMWDMRQASRAGSEAGNELTLFWLHKFQPNLKLQIYATKGFSEVSPDFGLGMQLAYGF